MAQASSPGPGSAGAGFQPARAAAAASPRLPGPDFPVAGWKPAPRQPPTSGTHQRPPAAHEDEVQRAADQPTHEGAVEADPVEVLADAGLQQGGQPVVGLAD